MSPLHLTQPIYNSFIVVFFFFAFQKQKLNGLLSIWTDSKDFSITTFILLTIIHRQSISVVNALY